MIKRSGLIALVLLCLLFLHSIRVEATDPLPVSSSVVSKRDPAFTITPEDLLVALREGREGIVLVDIRCEEKFAKTAIPGSLSLPLYSVKTKGFLKAKTVVLLNDGVNYASLEKEAGELVSRHGFSQVRILAGGLGHWRDSGGELTGNALAHKGLSTVSARDFFIDKNYDDWLVADTSPKGSRDVEKFCPTVHHLPFSKDSNDFTKRLEAAIKVRKLSLPYILIVNENGDYEPVKQAIANASINNIFYLDGGLKAYQDFTAMLANQRQPQKKNSACGVCP